MPLFGDGPAPVEVETLSDSQKLLAWLEEHGLSRHSAAITDPEGAVGITSLQELEDVLEEDVNEIVDTLGLNIGERKRMKRGIAELQSATQLAADMLATTDDAASPGAPDRKAFTNFAHHRDGPGSGYNNQQPTAGAVQHFEVIKSMVFVRSAPNNNPKSSVGIGILRAGAHIQVLAQRCQDLEGNKWVQLTDAEFWRSCEPEAGTDVKGGFVLIDGSDQGLGTLLRGPLLESELTPALPMTEAGMMALMQAQLAVAQGRAQPLNHEQRLQKTEEQHRKEEERRIEQERMDKQMAVAEMLDQAKASGKESTEANAQVKMKELAHPMGTEAPQGCVCMRSVLRYLFVKPTQTSQQIHRLRCRPGTTFYVKEGSEWQGPGGGLWMQSERSAQWLLTEEANHGGTALLEDYKTDDFALVTIDCLSSRGDIRVFEAFVSVKTVVRSLNLELCQDTGLKPKATFLFRTRPPATGIPPKSDVMQAAQTLASCNIEPGTEVALFLLYPFNFEVDYRGGLKS